MDDHQIIELYFARSETAIQETDQKYGKLCFGIAWNILFNREDAEECVNDTYLGVWNAIPPQRPYSFSAFISKITRNLSLKRLSYNTAIKRFHQTDLPFSELEATLPDNRFNPVIDDEGLGQIISDFLHSEKEESRNVFIRRYWFFDSVTDIAERYSFSESKVKSMLLRTRNRLRECLKKEGVYL